MKDLKNEIQLKLTGNIIENWCHEKSKDSEDFIYELSFNSGSRYIRFKTKKIKDALPNSKNALKYEIDNHDFESVSLSFVIDTENVSQKDKDLLKRLNGSNSNNNILKKWIICDRNDKIEDIDRKLEYIYNVEIKAFETELIESLKRISLEFEEGEIKEFKLTKYERNRKARDEAVKIHGSSCKVCGFNFEYYYGSEFKGYIEVHHIVPLSSIKHNYIVNPKYDLLPVCPNCHRALHSKKDGLYEIDELKEIIEKKSYRE